MGLISRVSSRTYRKLVTKKTTNMGIGRDSWHKRRKTGGRKPQMHKKRKLELGNFGWASEGVSRTTRIVDVVYNATSNELVRTKTLVKGAIVATDATPFRQFYESHYSKALGRKKTHEFSEEEAKAVNNIDNCGPETKKKYANRQKTADVAANLNSQFLQGKVLAKINSRPGQCGRADGYILEGDELDFYVKKMKTKKSKA